MRAVRPLALAAILLSAAPILAQETFPDVPRNHWAYAALERMKADGLLVGYPDGLYRGGRPMSRYELAVALHAAYANLKNRTDRIDMILTAFGAGRAYDPQGIKDAVAALQGELAALKGLGEDLADLRRATDTFELELTQLGVDVQAMKDDLRNLSARTRSLEGKPDPLEIGGRLDLWIGGGHTDGRRFGLNRDGRLTGTSDKGPNPSVASLAGITDDLAFLSEAAVDFSLAPARGPKVRGTLVLTNAFGQAPGENGVVTRNVGFGNQSDLFNPANGAAGSPNLYGYAEGSGDVYLQDLVFAFEGPRGDLELGRLDHKATPWIFQRIDNTLYYDNPRWDDGRYTFDGFRARKALGRVRAELYGGVDQELSANGVRIDTLRSGPVGGPYGGANAGRHLEASRLVGADLTAKVGGLELRGDLLALAADEATTPSAAPFEELDVYGGEAGYGIGRYRLSGGLRHTVARDGVARLDGVSGNAWSARVAWADRRIDLSAEYREVQRNYLAPGDWGRLGVLRNPTNLRGAVGKAKLALGPRFDLGLEGELDHGLSDSGATGTRLDRGTDVGRYAFRIDGRLGRSWDASIYYENTLFNDLAALPDARYQWYGVGIAHDLGANALFRLRYEQSAIRDDYQVSPGRDFRGGFLTTQVTVRF